MLLDETLTKAFHFTFLLGQSVYRLFISSMPPPCTSTALPFFDVAKNQNTETEDLRRVRLRGGDAARLCALVMPLNPAGNSGTLLGSLAVRRTLGAAWGGVAALGLGGKPVKLVFEIWCSCITPHDILDTKCRWFGASKNGACVSIAHCCVLLSRFILACCAGAEALIPFMISRLMM